MDFNESFMSMQASEDFEELLGRKIGEIYLPYVVNDVGVTEKVFSTIAEMAECINSPDEEFDIGFSRCKVRVPTAI